MQLTDLANGCIERFFRTLKEQLLWVRRFRDLDELRAALSEFRDRYNHHWIVHRLGYRTPSQARSQFTVELPSQHDSMSQLTPSDLSNPVGPKQAER